jgi:anti-sigma regulatory factor (Ser/Thr protein kinase)
MKAETHEKSAAAERHAALFYDDESELAAACASFLADCLATGGTAIVIATPAHRDAFRRSLLASGIDCDSASREGRLIWRDAAELLGTFAVAGRLDEDAFELVIGGLLSVASAAGGPIHAYGEMVALLWDADDVMGAIELERMWNRLATRFEFSLLCGYPSAAVRDPAHADACRQVCELHGAVIEADGEEEEPPIHPQRIAREFPAARESPRAARRFVDDALEKWGATPPLRADAELVISELATNAVIHAGSRFKVRASMTCSALRLSVQDESVREPVIRSAGPWAGLGFGLPTVDALAEQWGVEHTTTGKVVWAELEIAEPPTS